MSSQEPAEIRMQISSINAVYKQSPISFMTPDPPVHKMPEIEQSYVILSLTPLVNEISCNGASVIMKKDDIRRLDLMVGDTVTLKIAKS